MFVVPTGLYLVGISRKGLYATLGPTRMEFAVTREAMATVKNFVQRAPIDAWLSDVQTSMLLMPLASPENRTLVPEPAFGGSRLDVLGHHIAIINCWRFSAIPTASNDPVERALDWMASTAGTGVRNIGLLVGGWGISPAYRLATDLMVAGGSEVAAAGNAQLAAVIVDIQTLRAWRSRQARQIEATSRTLP